MEKIRPPHSDSVSAAPRKPLDGAAGSSRKRSELDVLRYLDQCAILLDHVLARWKQAGEALSVDERGALAGNLSIVSNVLRFLGQKVVPSLLADGPAGGALRQQATWEVLTRLDRLTAELEVRFRVPPATLN